MTRRSVAVLIDQAPQQFDRPVGCALLLKHELPRPAAECGGIVGIIEATSDKGSELVAPLDHHGGVAGQELRHDIAEVPGVGTERDGRTIALGSIMF